MKTLNFKNIKTGMLLILLLPVVLTSCAQSKPKVTKEVSIGWSEIGQGVGLQVGDILEVVLPTQPSTGYIWEVGFYNQSVLKPYGEPEFYNTITDLGGEEMQKLHFEAIGEGETELVLVYRRSFENEGADQQTYQVYVTVNKWNTVVLKPNCVRGLLERIPAGHHPNRLPGAYSGHPEGCRVSG